MIITFLFVSNNYSVLVRVLDAHGAASAAVADYGVRSMRQVGCVAVTQSPHNQSLIDADACLGE